ncbi:MAG: serine/threonine protein kinase [Planctomycetales bacterium]|nr:serine/threonine protein kinase [Planctomycetales bacterium]
MKNKTGDVGPTIDLPRRSDLEETAIFNSFTQEKVSSSGTSPKKDVTRRVGLVLGSSPSMSEESHERLRTRLLISALLLGSGLLVYLLFKFFNLYQTSVDDRPLIFWVHLTITVATLGAAWRLGTNCKFTLRHLRGVEFIVFCGPALLFTIASHAILTDSIKAGFVTDITSPWLLLIFTYTVLIPNTWQRAAMMIIPISLIPIGLAVSAQLTTEDFTQVTQTDPSHQMTMIRICLGMIWGAAIAIWGAWSIRSLRREAFEAKKMGQYQLKKLLGRGGMGEVYLAMHRMLKRPCALKLIRPDVADIRLNLKRFEREVQSTARLTHWNTIEIFDYGSTEDGVFYYVMEYLPGMNLDEVVRMNGPLPANRAIYLLKQVCEALAEAHGQGLIHRDIKPANIFSARRGGMYDVAKLLDFGLVRDTGLAAGPEGKGGDFTREGSITGSPLYMSPEQALSEVPDERSDIYSLGGVAYYLTTGQPPFVHDNAMRVILSHARDVPTPPSELNPDVPSGLTQVIMKCLEKKPEDRFANVRLLQQALIDCETDDVWNAEQAAHWWKHHGCPHKKKLDAEVLELAIE